MAGVFRAATARIRGRGLRKWEGYLQHSGMFSGDALHGRGIMGFRWVEAG